jgi:hypothetical protein
MLGRGANTLAYWSEEDPGCFTTLEQDGVINLPWLKCLLSR